MEVFGDILESIEELQGIGFEREFLLANSLLKCIVTFAISKPHQQEILVDEQNQAGSFKLKSEADSCNAIHSKKIGINKSTSVNSDEEIIVEPLAFKVSAHNECTMVPSVINTLNISLDENLKHTIPSVQLKEQNKEESLKHPFLKESMKGDRNCIPYAPIGLPKPCNIDVEKIIPDPKPNKDNKHEEKLLESINVANQVLGQETSQSGYYLKCKFCEYIQSTKVKNPHKTFQEHMQLSHELDNVMVVCTTPECSFERKVLWSKKNGVHNFSRVVSWMLHHSQAVHGGVWQDCDECGKKFADPNDLKIHKKRHIKMNHKRKKRLERKNKIIPCETCGKEMKSSSIQMHVQNSHSIRQDLFCSICSFSTKYSSYLKEHEDGHTTQIKCPTCSQAVGSRSMLKRHNRIIHEGGLLCSFCEYKADAPSRLAMHEETHNERTIKCDECEYIGKSKINLENHMRRHQEPRFKCKVCDYKTYDSSNFGKHKIIKHGSIKLKCDCCDYESKSKRSLMKHKVSHNKKSL